MNILIIEDNPSHLKLAHHVLSAAGYQVNGIEATTRAFEAIKADKPNLILLDLELPGMNGLAFMKLLKANPETADIPIVAVTAYPERYPRSEAMEAGCAGYVVKPINTRTLPGQLGELIH